MKRPRRTIFKQKRTRRHGYAGRPASREIVLSLGKDAAAPQPDPVITERKGLVARALL